jgi:hypothetical protein
MTARTIFIIGLGLALAGCAAMQPPNANSPGNNESLYPVIVAESVQRIESVNAAWAQINAQQGVNAKSQIELQPITSTIREFPQNFTGPLYLPKVGESAQMNDEERRESLRRFLNEWKTVLGIDPAQLTLINDAPTAGGARTAVYEQRPFTYPLRGPYGKVEVSFTEDRRILNVKSTAIPDTTKIQAVLITVARQIRGLDVNAKIAGQVVKYNDASGLHTFTIEPPIQATPQQLVVLALESPQKLGTLEFHLVWEMSLTNGPVGVIYFDILKNEVIATQPL